MQAQTTPILAFLAALLAAAPSLADVFQTPSGNIQCYADEGGRFVDCEIRESDVAPPLPRPLDCDFDWGQRFTVGASGRGAMACYSDTVQGRGYPVLFYGQSATFGAITCFSTQDGLQCLNHDRGGFHLSRRVQQLF